MNVQLLSLENILLINQKVCVSVKQESICMDKGKIESALASAFYPGDYPFRYGGISRVAGALCYFLIKAHAFMDANKRTAALAATMFMDINGYELVYPLKIKSGVTAFTNTVEKAASSQITKDQLIEWFDQHKQPRSKRSQDETK